jgi:hypothetical protein
MIVRLQQCADTAQLAKAPSKGYGMHDLADVCKLVSLLMAAEPV